MFFSRAALSRGVKSLSQEMRQVRRIALSQPALRHTVDEPEVEKHGKLGQEWWSLHGQLKMLHAMNDVRLPFIRDGILGKSELKSPTPLKGKKILDVACGGGILSEPLARLGAEVTGVDASSQLIEVAQMHAELDPKLVTNKPTYICTTIEDHAQKHTVTYDVVIASEIIEHITDKELFVKCCVSTLKPGGDIFVTTPNRTRLFWLVFIVIAENTGMIPKGTHELEKFTTPTELSLMLEKNNCRTQAIRGTCYSFIKKSFNFIRSKNFFFVLHALKK